MGNKPTTPEAFDLKEQERSVVAKYPLAITTIDASTLKNDDTKVVFNKLVKGDLNDETALLLCDVDEYEDQDVPMFVATKLDLDEFKARLKKEMENAAAEGQPIKNVILYVHGINCQPLSSFETARKMTEAMKKDGVLVIPVMWPAQDKGIYTKDRKINAPGAAKALATLCEEIASRELPISLLCWSCGNFVLREFASQLNTSSSRLKFQHIFMSAPDVAANTFETDDGPKIVDLVEEKVHVLHCKRDIALFTWKVPAVYSCLGRPNESGLGLRGFDEDKVQPAIDRTKLVNVDANQFDMDILGHSYHESKQAMDYYISQFGK